MRKWLNLKSSTIPRTIISSSTLHNKRMHWQALTRTLLSYNRYYNIKIFFKDCQLKVKIKLSITALSTYVNAKSTIPLYWIVSPVSETSVRYFVLSYKDEFSFKNIKKIINICNIRTLTYIGKKHDRNPRLLSQKGT